MRTLIEVAGCPVGQGKANEAVFRATMRSFLDYPAGTLMLFSALSSKGKRMAHDAQSAPDIAFLRNIGIALLALTIAVGGISVIGCLKTSELWMLAQSLDGSATARDAGILSVDSLGL